MTSAEMDAIDLEAWARRLGFNAFDDLKWLEDAIFGDLLERVKAESEPDEPVRVGQVDPRKRR